MGPSWGSEQSREKRKWRRQGRSLLRGATVVAVCPCVCLFLVCPTREKDPCPDHHEDGKRCWCVGTGTLLVAKQERTECSGAGGEGLGDLEEEEDHSPVES